MHLFFDQRWKLHIGEMPEKPVNSIYIHISEWHEKLSKYNEAIAAIKQNALTVGNPEIIESTIHIERYPHSTTHGLFGREIELRDYIPDKFYFWPGGYETLKTLHCDEYHQHTKNSCFTTVAILTLPEEKKNTMENIVEREFKQTGEILTDIVGDFFKRVIQDPKGMGIEVKEFENSDTRLSLLKRDDRTIAGVVETRTEFNNVEFIKFSLYKDHPTTASSSVTAPKEEGNTEPYFHLSKNEYGKMWLMYKPEGNGRYKCWEPITEEFWNEFEKLLR